MSHESQGDARWTNEPTCRPAKAARARNGGEVIVEDIGDAIVLRTFDQVVARAQALSRRLVGDKPGASIDDFLADRARQAEAE